MARLPGAARREASHPGKDLVYHALPKPQASCAERSRDARPRRGLRIRSARRLPSGRREQALARGLGGECDLDIAPFLPRLVGHKSNCSGSDPRRETGPAGRGLPRRPHSPLPLSPRRAPGPRGLKRRGTSRSPWLRGWRRSSPGLATKTFEQIFLKECPKLQDIRDYGECRHCLRGASTRTPRLVELAGFHAAGICAAKRIYAENREVNVSQNSRRLSSQVLHCPTPSKAQGGALAILDSEPCCLKFPSPSFQAPSPPPAGREPPAHGPALAQELPGCAPKV